MKRFLGCAALVSLLLVAASTQVSAQGVWFGGGVTIPTGDFSDFGDGDGANTGWMASGGIGIPIGDQGLEVVGEGFYGSNNHDTTGDKTNLFGGLAHLVYNFSPPDEPGVFVFGGAGLLVHQYSPDVGDSENDTNFAYNVGLGAGMPLGNLAGWVFGRFVSTAGADGGETTFVGITAGVSIPIGGSEGM